MRVPLSEGARSRAWPLAAAVLAGLTQALALALPGSGQPSGLLQIVGLAVFYALILNAASVGRAAWLGGLFATSWLCATFWWLFISMHVYGGLAAPLAVAAVLALAAFLALYYALAAALWARWRLRRPAGSALARVLLFGGLWLGAELLRGTLWTGFPWGGNGYAQVDNAVLRPFAPWLGVYGVGLLAAWIAAGLAEAVGHWRAGNTRLALRLLGVPLVIGALGQGAAALERHGWPWQGQDTGTLSVALLQGNIPQDEKFVAGAGIEQSLIWYGQHLWAARADLIVLPETAIPLLPDQLPPDYWPQLQQAVTSAGQAALVGMPLGNFEQGYTNSVVGIAPGQTDAQSYRYDKTHLVPFGEFIPPFFRWFTDLMNIPLGDFNRGHLGQPSFVWRGQRIAPNICYEDLFGEEIARTFLRADEAPTILANVSNIGWFGDTVAVAQHLQISRMRTLEFDRPMLRATNTGATAVIDHQARVTASAQPYTEAVLNAEVTGRSGITPYAVWAARWGLLPLELLAALAAVWALLARCRV
ncbi:MAG: Apolipoprotein N-acyltransferase [Paracidovorax wautersii]|uniref:Apolipoprotein N-acyltransferase n=1 Tax=Paracidovorax wautersii TaxID=1177982 RepID=A0A7V8FL51_9BURK|nr:MAG: Apolipoprotein N-acyltransferase [Paracidovorax wautersii]